MKRLQLGGEPRSPIDLDPGSCRFCGRCAKGRTNCVTVMPELRPLNGGRMVVSDYPEISARQRPPRDWAIHFPWRMAVTKLILL